MTTEIGSGQDSRPASGTVARRNASEPAWLARLDKLEGRQRRMIVVGVQLAALTRYLASRRFMATVIVAVVGVTALATLRKESGTRPVGRATSCDEARIERELESAE